MFGALLGTTALLGSLPFLAPIFFQKELENNPNWADKPAVFVKVRKGYSKLIIRGGRSSANTVIRGNDDQPYILPSDPEWLKSYKRYVWDKAGLHVIVPFLDQVYSYGLTRYKVKDGEGEDAGRKVYYPVADRSDHLRTDPFPWFLNFKGVEIQKITMTVKASSQIRIVPGMEEKAHFGTEAWHIMVDQAVNRVVRDLCRSQATIDKIFGKVGTDITKAARASSRGYATLNQKILEGVRNYTIERTLIGPDGTVLRNPDGTPQTTKEHLIDFGIDVMSFDIIDFEPELSSEELKQLRSAALAMETAKATVLNAQAEAEKARLKGVADAEVRRKLGEADAEAKEKILAAIKDNPDLAQVLLDADARVAMSKAGLVDAAAVALIEKLLK